MPSKQFQALMLNSVLRHNLIVISQKFRTWSSFMGRLAKFIEIRLTNLTKKQNFLVRILAMPAAAELSSQVGRKPSQSWVRGTKPWNYALMT